MEKKSSTLVEYDELFQQLPNSPPLENGPLSVSIASSSESKCIVVIIECVLLSNKFYKYHVFAFRGKVGVMPIPPPFLRPYFLNNHPT